MSDDPFSDDAAFAPDDDPDAPPPDVVAFVADDAWWLRLWARLDDDGRAALLAGELRWGVGRAPLVAPGWLHSEAEFG
jgi:hypothetical protein